MLFTCKHFMFSDFTWKKTFAPGSGGDGGGGGGGVAGQAPPRSRLSLRP